MPRLFFSPKRGAVSYADVTSANIVGFQNKDIRSGFSLTLPTFEGIGTALDIQQIVPKNIGDYVNGEISIQTFSTLGGMDEQYFYQTTASYWGTAAVDGWYLGDYMTLAEKTFTPGEGVMADSPDQVEFTYAGQVDLAKKEIPCATGFSLSGNLRPMETDIQDIVPEDIGDYVNGEISIQTFTSLGAMDEQYFYQTTASYWGTAAVDGWYLGDYMTLAEKTFAAGEGFMVDAPAEIKMTFKAIETK